MKRLLGQSTLVVVLSLLALMSILVGLVPRAAQALAAGTSVCGSIYVNTTWTVISSPYQVCNTSGVSVGPTATLTIQPGVTVQFQPGVNAKLYVQGSLTAIGTTTQPITFTGVVTSTVTPPPLPSRLRHSASRTTTLGRLTPLTRAYVSESAAPSSTMIIFRCHIAKGCLQDMPRWCENL